MMELRWVDLRLVCSVFSGLHPMQRMALWQGWKRGRGGLLLFTPGFYLLENVPFLCKSTKFGAENLPFKI